MRNLVRKLLVIDPDDIENEYARHAADYATWNQHLAAAQAAQVSAETALEYEKAKARLRVLRQAKLSGERKPNNDDIAARIATDVRVVSAKHRIDEAKADVGRIKAVCSGFSKKGDMIVSLGAHLRRGEEANGRTS